MNYTTHAGNPALPNTSQSTISTAPDTVPTQSKLQDLADVIEFCKVQGFPADVVGRWVWIKFDEKPDLETRDLLKSAGFRWIHKRQQWAHNCGILSRRGKYNPRSKYPVWRCSDFTQDEINSFRGNSL